MGDSLTVLVDHYHRTYDLTYRFWKERNRFFVLLLATLAVASLFTFDKQVLDPGNWTVPGTKTRLLATVPRQPVAELPAPGRNAFMLQLMCFLLNKDQGCSPDSKALQHLQATFPISVFDGVVSILVFYLMVNMLNHTSNIYRYYAYIEHMETAIRRELGIDGDPLNMVYSRESSFYRNFRAPLQRSTRTFFILIMLGLLGFYFFVRLASELSPEGSVFGLAVHASIAVLTLSMFSAYAMLLLGWKHPEQTAPALQLASPPIS